MCYPLNHPKHIAPTPTHATNSYILIGTCRPTTWHLHRKLPATAVQQDRRAAARLPTVQPAFCSRYHYCWAPPAVQAASRHLVSAPPGFACTRGLPWCTAPQGRPWLQRGPANGSTCKHGGCRHTCMSGRVRVGQSKGVGTLGLCLYPGRIEGLPW